MSSKKFNDNHIKLKKSKKLTLKQIIKKILIHDFHKYHKLGETQFNEKVEFLNSINLKNINKLCPICFNSIKETDASLTYWSSFCYTCINTYYKQYKQSCPILANTSHIKKNILTSSNSKQVIYLPSNVNLYLISMSFEFHFKPINLIILDNITILNFEFRKL